MGREREGERAITWRARLPGTNVNHPCREDRDTRWLSLELSCGCLAAREPWPSPYEGALGVQHARSSLFRSAPPAALSRALCGALRLVSHWRARDEPLHICVSPLRAIEPVWRRSSFFRLVLLES